jgi:hypothetical protein
MLDAAAVPRPIFIVGAARGGTTLTRALLGAHSAISLENETELFPALIRAGMTPDATLPPSARMRLLMQLVKEGSRTTRDHLAALPADRLAAFFTASRSLGLRDVYELLLPRPDISLHWGEKSFGNAYFMSDVAQAYPSALFVHVLRDPRATTMSWMTLHYLDSNEQFEATPDAVARVAFAAMRWASWTDAIDASAAALQPGAVARVRYEELVEHPEAVLGSLCTVLNVDFETGMLDPSHRESDAVMTTESRRRAHALLGGPVDSSRAHAGEQLPRWAVAVVERYCAIGMRRHAYDVGGDAIPVPVLDELATVEAKLLPELARDPSAFRLANVRGGPRARKPLRGREEKQRRREARKSDAPGPSPS